MIVQEWVTLEDVEAYLTGERRKVVASLHTGVPTADNQVGESKEIA